MVSGQVRSASGPVGVIILGWDMGAAMKMAEALGYSARLAAMWLPAIESIACEKMNDRLKVD